MCTCDLVYLEQERDWTDAVWWLVPHGDVLQSQGTGTIPISIPARTKIGDDVIAVDTLAD